MSTPAKGITNLQLADRLCEASATLREARGCHVQAQGAFIPHAFMSEVLAYVGTCLLAAATARRKPGAEVAGILALLEEGMEAGDRETRNVIAISFVGDACEEPFYAALLPRLGPRAFAQRRS